MRRTFVLILVLLALCAGAAHGSKKPRVSTAAASSSHKKAQHSARHSKQRPGTHQASSSRRFRFHRATRVSASLRTEPAELSDTSAEVETASLRKTRPAMPSPLRGSYESLVRQNEKSEATDGLERIEDDEDLDARIATGMLVQVPVSTALSINGNLPENRRYCRPWTASFLSDLSRAHSAEFHSPLLVTSAVRTVEYQKRLARINGNAAAAEGDIASPHLTGGTIDIAKQGLSRREIAWMRARLLVLQNAGKIDVAEEFHQACFHITVYKSYAPAKLPGTTAVEATATPTPEAQPRQSRPHPLRQKTRHRTPAQVQQDQTKPETSAPEREPAPTSEAPVEG